MATDAERIADLIEFYDSSSDSLPSWLDDNVDSGSDECPVLSAGSGTNQQKTANILKYEMGDLHGWENTYIDGTPPKPKYNNNNLIWAAANGSYVRVYWSGGNTDLSVSDALDSAEGFGDDNDTYLKNNVEFEPGGDPPAPPGGGG